MAAEQTRGIEETLRDLNFNLDAEPEVAAQEAADKLRDVPLPADTAGATSTVSVEEVEDLEVENEDDGILMPVIERALVPPPKLAKGKARDKSPAAAKLGKDLASKVPGAEKLRVAKRENGKLWTLGDFTKDDLRSSSDMQSFLREYIVPKFGDGEFEITGFDAHGREIPLGTERLRNNSATATPENNVLSMVERMMQNAKENADEERRRMQENMAQQQSPLQVLEGVMSVQEKLEEKRGGSGGNNDMIQLLIASQASQTQMLLAVLNKPAPAPPQNPLMDLLMAKMMKDLEGGGPSNNMPPPPPPAMDLEKILALVPAVITAIGSLAGVFGGGGGGSDEDFKEFLKEMLLKKDGDTLGLRDTLALVKELSAGGKTGDDALKEAVDKTAMLMNFARNFNQQQEGGGSASIWDAVTALLGNRDFAGSIANTIRAKTDQSGAVQAQQLAAERQRIEMGQRHLQKQQQRVPVNAPAAPQTSVVQPIVQATPPTPERVQEAVAKVGNVPPLPENTKDHMLNLANAKNDAETVKHMMNFLVYLADSDAWKGFGEEVLDAMRNGDLKKVQRALNMFLGGLVEIQLLTAPIAQRVYTAMVENFELIKVQVADMRLAKDEVLTGEVLLDGPAEDLTAAP